MADHVSSLPHVLSTVVSDLADLLQKEMRLVRAELSQKLALSIRAGVWMVIAAALLIFAALLVVQACVLGLTAATGIALHWSSLIVAAALGVFAGAAFIKGRAEVPDQIAPGRSLYQIKRDITAAKEQLT
jgi:uncharacterized membrane protein